MGNLADGSSATCAELDALIAVDREAIQFEKNDIDALEEERITEWHSGASPSSFSFPDVSEEVRGEEERQGCERGEREREERQMKDYGERV